VLGGSGTARTTPISMRAATRAVHGRCGSIGCVRAGWLAALVWLEVDWGKWKKQFDSLDSLPSAGAHQCGLSLL